MDAATGHHLTPMGWVALGGVVLLGGVLYLLSCFIWPMATCPKCKGDPRHKEKWGLFKKAFRPGCRRCKGTGRVLRLGARAWGKWRDSTTK